MMHEPDRRSHLLLSGNRSSPPCTFSGGSPSLLHVLTPWQGLIGMCVVDSDVLCPTFGLFSISGYYQHAINRSTRSDSFDCTAVDSPQAPEKAAIGQQNFLTYQDGSRISRLCRERASKLGDRPCSHIQLLLWNHRLGTYPFLAGSNCRRGILYIICTSTSYSS